MQIVTGVHSHGPSADVPDKQTDMTPGAGAPATKALALVVEDEATMCKFLRVALATHGYRVVEAESGAEALRQAAAYVPDIVLLDLGLADIDGIALIKRLREWATMPIVVISARAQEQAKVEALDAGADDYISKPFGVGELMARVRVALKHALRRAENVQGAVMQVGDLRMDLSKRLVFVKQEEVHLTPTEYKLLALLMQHAGMVMTQNQLLRGVWGPGHDRDAQYLRVYMAQLRRKLERDAVGPRYLRTETGVGYRIRLPSDPTAASRPPKPATAAPPDAAETAGTGRSA
jgi:two-component system KDP operon response regulator KdpE